MKPFRTVVPALAALAALTAVPALAQDVSVPKPGTGALPRSTVYDHALLKKRVTLSLKDADVNTAVKELARAAGVSLVVERIAAFGVRPLTLELKDAPLGDVLDAVGTAYGYRWRRKGEVFLLSLAQPGEEGPEDLKRFGEMAVEQFLKEVLTEEQRALAQKQGYIDVKDLTPGQQGVVNGLFQEMFRRAMSGQMGGQIQAGRIEVDLANKKFSITGTTPGAKN